MCIYYTVLDKGLLIFKHGSTIRFAYGGATQTASYVKLNKNYWRIQPQSEKKNSKSKQATTNRAKPHICYDLCISFQFIWTNSFSKSAPMFLQLPLFFFILKIKIPIYIHQHYRYRRMWDKISKKLVAKSHRMKTMLFCLERWFQQNATSTVCHVHLSVIFAFFVLILHVLWLWSIIL